VQKSRRSIAILGVLALAVIGLVGAASPAYAANVSCGQTITVSTVLDGNVGPCEAGITIGADGITFDLNGFTITGTAATGDGPGVYGLGRTGVTVKAGIVTAFDAGVVFENGSGNTVTQMQLLHNRGTTSTDFGDGIGFYFSNNNFATKNLVQDNGPYDGIGVLVATGNTIDQNKIIDNNQSTSNTAGIRLENLGTRPSSNNIVTRNFVSGSGIFGIELFAGATGNQIRFNQVTANHLDGLKIFAGGTGNILEGNISKSNSGNGIAVQAAAGSFPPASNNQLLRNTATLNALNNLIDSNANCGTNQWHGNQGPPATPPCTLNP
jgi:hypothetical protein